MLLRLAAALATCLGAAAVPAMAAPCSFDLAPISAGNFMPAIRGDGGIVLQPVMGATVDKPFTLEMRAAGPATLAWRRLPPPTKVKLYERLKVLRSFDNGASFETYCETDWTAVAELGLRQQIALDGARPTLWRIEVLEDNRSPTMTVLDEERGQLLLTGALTGEPIMKPGMLPYFDIARAKPPPLASCAVTEQAAVSDALPVTSARIGAGGLQIEGSAYVVSGRTLHLKLDRAAPGAPVTLLLRAKPVGYGIAPLPVCSIEVKDGTLKPGEWITATAPWLMASELRWYVGIKSTEQSPAITYAVLRERPASNSAQGQVSNFATDVYSCTKDDPAKQGAADKLKVEQIQFAYALTIRTDLARHRVTPANYRRIVDAILTSIDSWRIVCTACSPYQFAVVDIDGKIYVAAGLLHGFPGNFRATFQAGYPWDTRLRFQKSTGLFSSAASFMQVDMTAAQRQRFCLQIPEELSQFDASLSPLCRPSPPSSEQEMVVNFEWRTGQLSCNGGSAVVACWNGGDRIEMNLKDYAFYVGDTGVTLLGNATRGADLVRVFMHEVGHWLGLGHMRGTDNIMSDELAGARCIDDSNLKRINAVARGEAPRTYTAEALRYE